MRKRRRSLALGSHCEVQVRPSVRDLRARVLGDDVGAAQWDGGSSARQRRILPCLNALNGVVEGANYGNALKLFVPGNFSQTRSHRHQPTLAWPRVNTAPQPPSPKWDLSAPNEHGEAPVITFFMEFLTGNLVNLDARHD